MRRSIVLLAIGCLMSSAVVSAAPASVAEPMQLAAAYAPEKAVTSEAVGAVSVVIGLSAPSPSEGWEQAHGKGGDPDYDSPAPNFASGNPDHDNPMHSLVAQGVDPDTDADEGRPNTDGISLASIPGDNEDGEGDGRMPLAA